MFVKQNGRFRPAADEITFQVSDRVTPDGQASFKPT